MPKLPVYNLDLQQVSDVDLSDEVFDVPVKPHLIYEVVKMQLASRRQGTVATKNRSAVRGGGKKPYRQKGTGRARQGTRRSPIHVGGGVAHGPLPKDWSYKVPKKVRKQAMRSALSLRKAQEKLLILEDFQLEEIRTKRVAQILGNLKIDRALIVDERNEYLTKSARNIQNVLVLPPEGLNVFDLMRFEKLVITLPCITKIEGKYKP